RDYEAFNRLATELFAAQFEHVGAYRQFCISRKKVPETLTHWSQIPAVPTSAFKDLNLSSLGTGERTAMFLSSGTTEQRPSRHFHGVESLAIYEASLLPWFKRNFFGDWETLFEESQNNAMDEFGFIILTPPPALARNSSLVHMFEMVRQ